MRLHEQRREKEQKSKPNEVVLNASDEKKKEMRRTSEIILNSNLEFAKELVACAQSNTSMIPHIGLFVENIEERLSPLVLGSVTGVGENEVHGTVPEDCFLKPGAFVLG